MIINDKKLKDANQELSKMEIVIFWHVVSEYKNALRWKPEYFSSYLLKVLFYLIREKLIWEPFHYPHGYITVDKLKDIVKDAGYENDYTEKFWKKLSDLRTIGANADSYVSDFRDIDLLEIQYARWNNFKSAIEDAQMLVNDMTDNGEVESVEDAINKIIDYLQTAGKINLSTVLLNMQDFS